MYKAIISLSTVKLLVLISAIWAHAQNNGRIDYFISDTTINIKLENAIVNMTVELNNSTSENFVMYGFKNTLLIAPTIDSAYSISKAFTSGSGNKMFLLTADKQRAQIWSNSTIQNNGRSQNRKSLTSELADLYLEGVIILPHNSKTSLQLSIDFSDAGPLEKGEYFFYMIYASGSLAKNVIGTQRILKDEEEWNAVIFNGFVTSNLVKLFIE